ncbi:Autophagy-related protein 13-like protein [Aphelenchoides bicaudatus]|nr:Autophagy-related protein 13-like protein [Aphelenchoides bicaudatus]
MSRRDSKNAEQPITELQTFQKYLRYFCMRFVHVIVHSRMGVPLDQPCEANPTNLDWFNFKHDEFGEISAYLKQSVKKYPPQISALTVDIFLYTAAGESLPLESWVVRVSPENADENINTATTLYRQLGTLLMSVCAAARATPASRYYTRSQGEKTYVLCYRVLESEPEADLLGPEYKTILLGNYPSAFGSVQIEFNYRTRMELPLPPTAATREHAHHFTREPDGAGIFIKASIPIKKPLEQHNRLIMMSDQKPKAKNWFSPSSEGLPFIADLSKPKSLTPCQSVESEPAIPTLYQNLPAEVLATMPDELKAPKSSECGSSKSDISINLKKRESFPFSMLTRDEDEQKNEAQSDSTSLSNFRFPMNANSSSDSSGASKRYDSDASTSSSIRETIRQKQRRTDEIFGFLEDDEDLANKTTEVRFEPLASSPLHAFIPLTEEIGPDLDAFVKEFSMAPRNINSFGNDDFKLLNEQILQNKGSDTEQLYHIDARRTNRTKN